MSKDLNSCSFIGRLGKDPETRVSQAGKSVTTITLACSDDYRNKDTGETVNQTNWVRIVFFNRLSEIASQYLVKGSQIFVSGKQKTRSYDDNNGQKKYITEIVANELQMLGGKGDASSAPAKSTPPMTGAAPDIDFEDDAIPFNKHDSFTY